jgi:PST family polysaccharide transporter
MVNQQTEIALLLGAPILLGMFLFSPVAVIILYSPEFLPAAELVRLFVFGDLIKMTAFPQRYVVMSSGRGIYFLFVETLPICLLLLVVMMFKGAHGLYAVGWGYVGMNVLILVMSAVFVKVKYGFVWDGFALRIFYLTLILLLCSFFVVNIDNKLLFLGFSMLIMLISVVFNIRRLLFLCAENQPKISIFNAIDRIYFLLKKQFSVFR